MLIMMGYTEQATGSPFGRCNRRLAPVGSNQVACWLLFV